MRIADLSDIHSGYTARGRLDPVHGGGVPAMQLRDVGVTGDLTVKDLQRYDLGSLADRYFVCGGEVVFRSRGETNIAVAVPDPLPEPVVVTVPLVIVRPNSKRILPEYLAWAINQPDAQRRLGGEAQGTGLRMIPMAALEDLEIAVPDLQTQRRIVELDALARQEGQLLRQLAARRETLVSAILGDAAQAADQKETAR
ncbi:restriction endonuclease subunit S [Albidovulum sediminis]|jgi:restriction endonuclease S subunit|uniref:Restriction endonuclease subunit S n=1 Tax=Albidovulum sediminis TaxID=3066345 RepID=A0ABT2NST2_9RHOB|nr:restriction endonuclease subunit S [Defluviimonas sediminis]MCT8331971.1 restriction endonuclease subunit S [Defluviimonas sediminis]